MHSLSIRNLLILGTIAIAGIIFIQSYWVFNTWKEKASQFDMTVNISLRQVADKIAKDNKSKLPRQDVIQRKSSNYYAVNINDIINPMVLENYLIEEFETKSLNTDFEYAVYDCTSQKLAYGNYCKISDDNQEYSRSTTLPQIDDLTYYFVVKFPSKASFLLADMWTSIIFSIIALLAVAFFAYSTWVILKQRRLSEMQRDFINNMTHEFKTPIASIRIASEMLANQAGIVSDKRTSKYVDIIKDQNARLNEQVEKVLNIAKFEGEDYQINKEKLDLDELLKDIAASENIRLSQGKGGVVNTNVDEAVTHILADKVHFTNCIYSLVDNAIKYCKKVPSIFIKSYKKGEIIYLEINDNGIGIKEDQVQNIFNKFYRIPTGNVHDVKGFGLGLFYVKNICIAHSWKIKVDSTPDVGTQITLQIPIS